ncbi:ribosome biogenesis GTPase Der, partial [Flavobacterium sp.]|uniref:ribosome biogenesis GTPase Der n=1 Tax=Flavobacterium sp. TaxID=239 RepID=UPI003C3DFBE6
MNNIVAIVGRPNVGKSTLFNRLIQRREAIVDSVSGVTRDRNYGKSEWNGKEFSVIDTGGYVRGSDDVFEGEIRKQVELAIDEADVIIFVVDVEEGITPMDDAVAKLLRKVTKPVLLAVNKVDNAMREKDAVEFYNLGLGEYYTFASISGSGTGDLLDALIKAFPEKPEVEEVSDLPRFAVVGRPNAGKSSFINALIGKER